MKYLKMIGLAAVAAMALMAFAGAGTASADELCSAAPVENMCPSGTQVTTIHATLVGSAILEETGGKTIVTCTAGTLHADVTNQGTGITWGSGPITSLTWGQTGTACTLPTKTLVLGTLDGMKAAGGGTEVKATETQVTVNTVLFGSCVYGAGAGLNLGTVPQGGSELPINVAVNKISGGSACPETTKWTATFKVTSPTALYAA